MQAITCSLRRGIDGELGREGKKGAAADSLRAVISFSRGQCEFFAGPFASTIVPSLLKLLGSGGGVLQAQAGNALAAIASATVKAQVNPAELKINAPDDKISVDVGTLMRACFVLKPPKTKGGEVQLTAVLHTIAKFFQALNAVCASRDAASAAESKGEAAKSQPSPTMQAAAHMSAMWALTVLSSILILTDGCLFRPSSQGNLKSLLGPGDGPAPATTAAKIIRILLGNKRIAIRTAASWAWRAFTWVILREFERMDEEESPEDQEQDFKEQEVEEERRYTKYQEERMDILRRSFDFVDKGVGVGIICALLVGSVGREDREARVDLALEALLEMARRKSSAADALQVFQRLMSIEGLPDHDEEEGGPSLGWDINKLLPGALFDGRLAEADSKSLLVLARDERELNREGEWAEELMPVTRAEGREKWVAFFEIWQACLKSHGIDDNGMIEVCT